MRYQKRHKGIVRVRGVAKFLPRIEREIDREQILHNASRSWVIATAMAFWCDVTGQEDYREPEPKPRRKTKSRKKNK